MQKTVGKTNGNMVNVGESSVSIFAVFTLKITQKMVKKNTTLG